MGAASGGWGKRGDRFIYISCDMSQDPKSQNYPKPQENRHAVVFIPLCLRLGSSRAHNGSLRLAVFILTLKKTTSACKICGRDCTAQNHGKHCSFGDLGDLRPAKRTGQPLLSLQCHSFPVFLWKNFLWDQFFHLLSSLSPLLPPRLPRERMVPRRGVWTSMCDRS